jgi:hypothetical protein
MKKFANAKIGGAATVATHGVKYQGIVDAIYSGSVVIAFEYEGKPKRLWFTEGTGKLQSIDSRFRGALVAVEYNAPGDNKVEDILFEQTAFLKEEYIKLTGEWAIGDHSRMQERARAYSKMTIDHNTDRWEKEKYYKEGRWYYATNWSISLKEYVEKMKKQAKDHYTDCIKKLAYRIEQKKMISSDLQIKTAKVGVNIETTFTDGIQTVRAWTIIARGPIQRPHYRYLIK